jgi:hypothetical protein
MFNSLFELIENETIEYILYKVPILIVFLNIILSLLYVYMLARMSYRASGIGGGFGIMMTFLSPRFYAPFVSAYFAWICLKRQYE